LIDILKDELEMTMRLMGVLSIEELKKSRDLLWMNRFGVTSKM
jgi:isopentenyl diphosphate isomerase/L-lactate dehydrogenase-like FMN-dependent dehydrogenase